MSGDAQRDANEAEIAVIRLDAAQAVERIFHAVTPNACLGISARRPGLASTDPYPHPFEAPHRGEFESFVAKAIGQGAEAVYTMLATFRSPLARPQGIQPYSFEKRRCESVLGLFLDLDVGRSKDDAKDERQTLRPDEALTFAIGLVKGGVIPLPTLTACSGRGRYLFYIFPVSEPNSERFRRRLELVHDALRIRLAPLSPDPTSRNIVQLFKAPGSPCACGVVGYEAFEQNEIVAPYTTLSCLETFLSIDPAASTPIVRTPAEKPGVSTRRPQQCVAFARVRMAELERLVPHRKRWTGWRHHLLLVYAESARHVCRASAGNARRGDERAASLVLNFNRTLPDPEDESIIRTQILASPLPRKPQRNETIAQRLEITIEESRRASLESLAHADVVAERIEAKRRRRANRIRMFEQIDELLSSGTSVSEILIQTAAKRATVYRRKARRKT